MHVIFSKKNEYLDLLEKTVVFFILHYQVFSFFRRQVKVFRTVHKMA